MNDLPAILSLGAVVFGTFCFLFQVMRSIAGRSRKLLWQDHVTYVGQWLSPVTWVVAVVYLMAYYVDHLQNQNYKAPPETAEDLAKKILKNSEES